MFGRKLEDGWAVLLINWFSKPQIVSCDTKCMQKMEYTDVVSVRGLWAHTDNATARQLVFMVEGGSSLMVKISAAGATIPSS